MLPLLHPNWSSDCRRAPRAIAIWLDATGGKIWFAYKGHLLRLPMPAQPKLEKELVMRLPH
jgi:hypothetical protein